MVHLFADDTPSPWRDLGFLVLFILVIPSTLFLFVTYRGFRESQIVSRLFSTPPFHEMAQIGFNPIRRHELERWKFTQPGFSKRIGSFEVEAIADLDWNNTDVKILIKCQTKGISKSSLKQLGELLHRPNLSIEREGISRKFNVIAFNQQGITYSSLNQTINEFVEALYLAGIQPQSVNQNIAVNTPAKAPDKGYQE